jgi:hypothetical protein
MSRSHAQPKPRQRRADSRVGNKSDEFRAPRVFGIYLCLGVIQSVPIANHAKAYALSRMGRYRSPSHPVLRAFL